RPGRDGAPDHARAGHRPFREADHPAARREDREGRADREGPCGARQGVPGRGSHGMRSVLLRTANIVKVGLRSIARNKMRSALTMLGLVFGVGCVIVTNGIGNGASVSIQSNINSLGANVIMIFPGAVTAGGARIFSAQSSLTEDDAHAIKAECPSVAYVSPGARTAGSVVAGE